MLYWLLLVGLFLLLFHCDRLFYFFYFFMDSLFLLHNFRDRLNFLCIFDLLLLYDWSVNFLIFFYIFWIFLLIIFNWLSSLLLRFGFRFNRLTFLLLNFLNINQFGLLFFIFIFLILILIIVSVCLLWAVISSWLISRVLPVLLFRDN